MVKTKEVTTNRPKVFIDLKDQDLVDCSYMSNGNHYAVRFSTASILVRRSEAEKMAWVILQRQTKLQRNGSK